MEIPVYLFTGFLEAGKTSFIQGTLSDPQFFKKRKERTLVILCEEGEETLDPGGFASPDIFVETLDNQRQLNPDKFESLRRKHGATRVLIEYNGMWLLNDLFQALPEEWFVYQEMMFADSSTIAIYNANMRNLVVDKLSTCDLVAFNRCDEDTDIMALHKLVRAVSRRTEIVYERVDGSSKFDDIEDPLPFDVNAPVINVEDRDFALFYRDLSESMPDYDGKTVCFTGMVSIGNELPKDGFIIGRQIMTCCVEDIAFSGLFCENGAGKVTRGEWVRLKAKISVKRTPVYGREGPVLSLIDVTPASAPADPVATFY